MKKPNEIHILVACEESQAIANSFRERGFDAYSCDIIPCSGGHPEYHILCDAWLVINKGGRDVIPFFTENKLFNWVPKWDLIIAHPPCTYLTVSGNRWFNEEKYGEEARRRSYERERAVDFFMEFVNCDCPRVAIENPVGIMSTRFRPPNQYIQPYEYGDPYTKKTGLWMRGLPRLTPSHICPKPSGGWLNQKFTKDGRYGGYKCLGRYSDPETKKQRSKTFPGIAKAIASQWGDYLLEVCDEG